MRAVNVSRIKKMSVPDRLSIIEDIWDSIAHDADQVKVPEWHREVLRKRLAAYRANPMEGKSRSEVRRRIERSRKTTP